MRNNKIGTVKINFCSWHKVLVELMYNMLFPKFKTHSAPISGTIYVWLLWCWRWLVMRARKFMTRVNHKSKSELSKKSSLKMLVKNAFFHARHCSKRFSLDAFPSTFLFYFFSFVYVLRPLWFQKLKKILCFNWGK